MNARRLTLSAEQRDVLELALWRRPELARAMASAPFTPEHARVALDALNELEGSTWNSGLLAVIDAVRTKIERKVNQ